MERYKDECEMLAYLAKKQLNLEKNRVKEDFEKMRPKSIMHGLQQEFWELYDEIDNGEFDFKRIRAECGDCASYLVGLLARINYLESKETENENNFGYPDSGGV